MAELKERAGRVDVLVNNAGYNVNGLLPAMKLEDYDAVAAIARGTWYLTKLVLRRFMLRQGSGRIINITSVVGHTGNPGQTPYTMVKAGLDALTKSLAQELAGRPDPGELGGARLHRHRDDAGAAGAACERRSSRASRSAAWERRKRWPRWSPGSPRAPATCTAR